MRVNSASFRWKSGSLSVLVAHRKGPAAAALGFAIMFGVGCQEQTPVALNDDALPGAPITVTVEIPWSAFASNLEVFGGYGSAEDIGQGVLAEDFAGTLDARTLLRIGSYPRVATVQDTTGASRPDSTLTILGGRFVAFFDTIESTNSGAVTLALGAITEEWDQTTASWDFAVDTINDERPWSEAGGGVVLPVAQTVWDPLVGDTAVFVLDSAEVAAWADTTDLSAGARIEILDSGERLSLSKAVVRLDARPSSNPDTIIELTAVTRGSTFIYNPFPQPPPDGVRIGGAPSWRTILDVNIPEILDNLPDFCAVVRCPHELSPGEISYAALVLTSRATEAAFQPTDSIRLDVRPVLNRAAMPKSPLGVSLIVSPFGRSVAPEAFGSEPGLEIEIPFTGYARDRLRGTDASGNPTPETLALLSVIEPFSITFASFEGPQSAAEPFLRLVLTIGPPVELP